MNPPRAVLFDVGGVLLQLHFERAIATWAKAAQVPDEVVKTRFQLDSPAHRLMETGRMSMPEYWAALRTQLGLSIGLDDMERGWRAILGDPMPGIESVIAALRAAHPALPLYVLSNTGAAHAPVWRQTLESVLVQVERVYCSYEIGLMKPDAACFAHLCADLGLAGQDILFFDDTAANVRAAQAFGLAAVEVRTAHDVRAALAARLPQKAP